jgi:hypothetical protein
MNTKQNSSLLLRLIALPVALVVIPACGVGCAGRVAIMPNSDKTLRRTPAQFAAEAAKRTYPTDIPSGGTAEARAQVAYEVDQIQMLNLSQEDWTDVELWVNRKYVVHIPRLEAGKKRAKTLTFLMLYDDQGNPFPSNNSKQMISSLEMVRDGKKYNVPLALADK